MTTTTIEPAETEVPQANKFQVMPPLADDDFAALMADIKTRGVLVPVEYDEDGNVLDGHHRLKACDQLGITDWPRVVRPGLTEAEKRSHAVAVNIARRHLTSEQKRELIAQQLADTPERSDLSIAKDVGVSDKTVGSMRKKMEARSEIPNAETRTDSTGRQQPASKPKAERKPPAAAPVDPQKVHNSLRRPYPTGDRPACFAWLVEELAGFGSRDFKAWLTTMDRGRQEAVKKARIYAPSAVAMVKLFEKTLPRQPGDGRTSETPCLGRALLAAGQVYVEFLQAASDAPANADVLADLNEEELADLRSVRSRIKEYEQKMSSACERRRTVPPQTTSRIGCGTPDPRPDAERAADPGLGRSVAHAPAELLAEGHHPARLWRHSSALPRGAWMRYPSSFFDLMAPHSFRPGAGGAAHLGDDAPGWPKAVALAFRPACPQR